MDIYKVKLTFIEPLLGTAPKDKEIYTRYIADKAQERAAITGKEVSDDELAEEIGTIDSVEERGWTGFHTVTDAHGDKKPFLYNYTILGFLKEACGMLRRVKGTESHKLRAYKKVIDGLVFVAPRRIQLDLNGGEIGVLERPLRASTPQGDRVALVRSDTAPEGTTVEFVVKVLGVVDEELLRELFSYGEFRGLGQWRNGSWGSYTYEMERL